MSAGLTGVAVVTAVSFTTLGGREPGAPAGGYGPAPGGGLRVTLALLGLALLPAVADALRRGRGRQAAR
ncbi:MAG: hypothetical protein ACYC1Z_09370 [Georgenia sp.]